MRISPLTAYSKANLQPKSVNFGMFGDKKDAQDAKEGKDVKPSDESVKGVREALLPVINKMQCYQNLLVRETGERFPAIDFLQNNKKFLFFKNGDNISIRPIMKECDEKALSLYHTIQVFESEDDQKDPEELESNIGLLYNLEYGGPENTSSADDVSSEELFRRKTEYDATRYN